MNKAHLILAAAGLALAACGGQGDDSAADLVTEHSDAVAEDIEQQAETMEAKGLDAQAEALEQKAEATRESGEKTAEVLDEANVEADGVVSVITPGTPAPAGSAPAATTPPPAGTQQ